MGTPLLRIGIESDHEKRIRSDWAESLKEHLESARPPVTRQELRRRLAELGVHVTEQAIGSWLRGETSPRPSYQAAIATSLRVPVRRLFPLENLPEAS